ncbi:PUA-like domain-containing protein, partial [Phyllosticta paracitricarpa]
MSENKTSRAAAQPRSKRTAATAQPKTAKAAEAAPKKRGRPAVTQPKPAPKTNAKAPKAKAAPKAAVPESVKGTKRKRTVAETTAAEEPQPKRRGRPPGSKNKVTSNVEKAPKDGAKSAAPAKKSTVPKEKPTAAKSKAETSSTAIERDPDTGIAHWLMKAEPESRIENGVDVKFSIDDLAAATEPEAWDGVRNHVAKNNMMSMKKGDLAFFYHSNCKTPGIAGIMEIVEEAAPDESAFDSKHPYYDSKSSRDKPTWHCVKVAFCSKFDHPERLTLNALKPLAANDGPLANMQLFKQSRLSVSKVSLSEWDFITSHATGETEDLAADEPVLVENDV